MVRPVYQMCLGLGPDHAYGYIFPSETAKDLVSSPVFTIPLKAGDDGRGITKETYELAGTLNKKLETYTLQHDGEVFFIRHEELKKPIRFAFYYPFDPLAQLYYPYIRSFPYVGKKLDVIQPYTHFVPIMPVDIQLMDAACEKRGMVFVGKTDVFPVK